MNKALFLVLVLISGYTTSLHACEDFTFSIDFNGEADIPETVNYFLEDNNGGTTGFITIAGESNFPFVLCVEGDCFALTIYTDDVLTGVEAINVELNQGAFYSELYNTDLGYAIEGCIDYNTGCPEVPLYLGSECLNGIFEIGSFVEGEEVQWNFGDGTLEMGGHFTTHEYELPGTYQVCGFYTSPLCEGAEYCGEVVIEGCGSPCDLEVEVFEQLDCGAYHCGIINENINSFDWFLDGELYWEDGNYMVVYLQELGVHELCAVAQTDECGTFETCITLVAEGCEATCTDVQFGLLNLSEEINYVQWTLSGPGVTLAEGVAQFIGFGTEWVDLCIDEGCYYFEVYSPQSLFNDDNFSLSMQGVSGPAEWVGTVNTPQYLGFEFCVGPTLVYPQECPTSIWTDGACDVTAFEIGSFQQGEVAIWNFGDGTIETGGHFTEHVYEEEGWYTICVDYSSNSCEGVEACIDMYINPCEPCPTEINIESDSDCIYSFSLIGANPDSSTFWTLDGNYVGESFEALQLQMQEPGWHTICADYSFVGCWDIVCTEFLVEGCGNDCPSEIETYIDADCNGYFELLLGDNAGTTVWYIDDELVAEGPPYYTEYIGAPGWHTVCAFYIAPWCEGVEICSEFFVEGCGTECNANIYADTNGCIGYFYVEGISDFVDITWTFGDQVIETQFNTGFTWQFEESGWHPICAEFYTEECGEQIICNEIYIEGCNENPCSPELVILGTDGCGSEIMVNGISIDVPIAWSFNDVYFTNDNNYWFGYDYLEDGWYTICAEFYTEECGGVFLCEEVYIQGCGNTECYLDGYVQSVGCGQFIFNLFANNEFEQYPDIYLDGEYYSTGWGAEFVLDPGEYVICGLLPATEFCDTIEFCVDVVSEDCDCPTAMEINTNGCLTIIGLNQNDGDVTYTIYGDDYQESFSDETSVFTWEAPSNGFYEVCAYYQSEFCEGISICDGFEITGCSEETPCLMEFSYSSGENGYYIFEASNNQDAPIQWFVNGEYIESGNAFDWTFNEPGSYEVCATFESEACPEGIISCVNIIVPEDYNCTEVTITIDVEGDLLEDFDIAYELEGLDFPFGGDFTIYNNCGSTIITFCVPDGCYEMTMSLEEFLEVALILEMFVEGGLEYDYTIDPLTQTVMMEFGINTDCSTGVLENVAQELEVYPIPSSTLINVKHSLANATWRIFDAQGRVVDQGVTNGNHIMVLDIQSYATGTYVIQLIGADSTLQQRFQKVE